MPAMWPGLSGCTSPRSGPASPRRTDVARLPTARNALTLHRHPRRDSNSEAQKPPPPKRPLYTPKAKQARIIAASLAGKSQRQIAREVGADRETVRRVLSQSEVQALLDAHRDRLRSIVPNALSQFEHELAILPK